MLLLTSGVTWSKCLCSLLLAALYNWGFSFSYLYLSAYFCAYLALVRVNLANSLGEGEGGKSNSRLANNLIFSKLWDKQHPKRNERQECNQNSNNTLSNVAQVPNPHIFKER